MTAVRTIWKKLAAAVFWLISGALVLITAATHHEAHRARHAAPTPPKAKPQDDDARTIVWLARLHEVPARVMTAPFIIAGTWLAAFAAVMPRTATPVGATAPGSNDARTSVGVGNSVPWADVDQYLTDDAKRYPADFDRLSPVLAGELAPLPWLEPTLPPLPEPETDWKPHACGDVDQPTAILRAQADLAQVRLDGIAADRWEDSEACRDGIADEPDPSRWCWRVLGHQPPHRDPYGREWTQDVPGPAESASPTPLGGAEAASPPAVVAGPGTPPTPGPAARVTSAAGSSDAPASMPDPATSVSPAGPGVAPDDTVTDMAAADRAFVADVAARPLDWAAWLHVCQHGDLDTVRAVTP